MELRIEFYSKNEVAVRLDFGAGPAFPESGTTEILLFTCFALRQFSNLGNHPVAKVLGVLFATFDKETIVSLARGTYAFPDKVKFTYLLDRAGVRINVDHDVFRKEIMPGLPSLVESRGQGKKAFVATIPPFLLHPKGFGILGFQVNYYAFQSCIALLRHLALRHIYDETYLDQLSKVTQYCGMLHITKGIPMGDQVLQANAIMKQLGIVA